MMKYILVVLIVMGFLSCKKTQTLPADMGIGNVLNPTSGVEVVLFDSVKYTTPSSGKMVHIFFHLNPAVFPNTAGLTSINVYRNNIPLFVASVTQTSVNNFVNSGATYSYDFSVVGNEGESKRSQIVVSVP